jgi:DNA repair protein RecN (Recombination protein N)
MLTHIFIKNFAIVDTLEIDFTQGLSVLTGETGAGKSLWVDAINLALGQRADSSWIRPGTERTEITVTFNISSLPAAVKWLQTEALDQENECILRRVITKSGSSRSTVNGSPIPLQRIRELSELLIQVHGQHQQQHLLQSDKQRQLVDDFAGNHSTLKSIKALYKQWRFTQDEIDKLLSSSNNKDQEIDFLKYQLTELSQLDFKDGEWQTLSRQHQQLHNAKSLLEQLNQAIDLTVEHENVSASQLIQQAIHQLDDIKIADPQLVVIRDLLNTAAIHINEAGNELASYRSSFDVNCNNAEEIESRLSLIYDLSRKHHCNPEDLTKLHQSLQLKLDNLLSIDEKVATLRLHQTQLEEQYQKLATTLTNRRKKAAKKLEKHVSESMRTMDIQDGEFHIDFESLDNKPTPSGNEKITFLVQTNAGQGIQPLHKIASGGEISRISLALHVLTASQEETPTLVFDEVDVGISGKTAAIVGQLLRKLGSHTQVLCITHLPQVAANGHHHYKINKTSDGKQTQTNIEKLDSQQRIDEIARLIGGTKITAQSRAHASELLNCE